MGKGVEKGRVVRCWSGSLQGRMWYWRRESGSGPQRRKAASEGAKIVAEVAVAGRDGEARRRVRDIERKPESVRACVAAEKRGEVVDVVVAGKWRRVRVRVRRTTVALVRFSSMRFVFSASSWISCVLREMLVG